MLGEKEKFVMDLGNGYKVVNLVDWDKAVKEETEIGGFNKLSWHRMVMDSNERWIPSCARPVKDENGDIRFKDSYGEVFQIYAVHNRDGKPSAVMLVRDGALQEFKVKEASAENISHVKKFAEYLNEAYPDVFMKLFVDKDKCSTPKDFVIKGNVVLSWLAKKNNCDYVLSFSEGVFPDLSNIIVDGNFDIRDQGLSSLDWVPKIIKGYFNCSGNKLQNLQGGPDEVGKWYDCSKNELIDFEGAPHKLGGNFIFGEIKRVEHWPADDPAWSENVRFKPDSLHRCAYAPAYMEGFASDMPDVLNSMIKQSKRALSVDKNPVFALNGYSVHRMDKDASKEEFQGAGSFLDHANIKVEKGESLYGKREEYWNKVKENGSVHGYSFINSDGKPIAFIGIINDAVYDFHYYSNEYRKNRELLPIARAFVKENGYDIVNGRSILEMVKHKGQYLELGDLPKGYVWKGNMDLSYAGLSELPAALANVRVENAVILLHNPIKNLRNCPKVDKLVIGFDELNERSYCPAYLKDCKCYIESSHNQWFLDSMLEHSAKVDAKEKAAISSKDFGRDGK